MRFSIYQESRQGARHANEDRVGYVHTDEAVMIIACDGMGGVPHGDLAAQFVLEFLARTFRLCARPRLMNPALFLRDSILAAHDALRAYAVGRGLDPSPCTTCVIGLIQDEYLWLAHAGDSRGYLLRDRQLAERTIDHSYVQALVDCGRISAEDALTHPERNKIVNCIGQPMPLFAHISAPIALAQEDIVLVCTDGLWGSVDPDLIADALTQAGLSPGLSMLMDVAESCAGRGCDNLSAVALHWHSVDDTPHSTPQLAPGERTITDTDVELAVKVLRTAANKACFK